MADLPFGRAACLVEPGMIGHACHDPIRRLDLWKSPFGTGAPMT
jgi:hypothetical protein